MRPEHRHHACSNDFVADRRVDGRPLKTLTIFDAHTRERRALDVERELHE